LLSIADAEMQVFPGDPAGCAGNGDGLSGSHTVLRGDQDAAQVAVN